MSPLDLIAPNRRPATQAALAAVFGTAPVEAAALSGGASGAQIFRVAANGRHALLRVEGAPSPLRFPDQYVSWQAASDAGIAPPLLYLDAPNGITVSAFVVQQNLRDYPGGPRALAQAVGELIRRLQATPRCPAFMPYPEIVERLFAHVRSTGVFADGVLDPPVEHLARLRSRAPWGAQVSAHNDLNPRNILFDGVRLWLIDWESAYRNDPLVDAAIALDNFAATPELEATLLHAAFGEMPDAARLSDVRSLTRLYYAGVLLSAVATMPQGAPVTELTALTCAQFLAAAQTGALAYGTREMLLALGKLFLASFMDGRPVPPLGAV